MIVDHSRHFERSELACHHCGECLMDEDFMQIVDKIREDCGFPITIDSGYRCKIYDDSIRGDGNHPQGRAIDPRFHNGQEFFAIVFNAYKHGIRRFGLCIQGINPTRGWLHFDNIIEHRPQNVIWGYK